MDAEDALRAATDALLSDGVLRQFGPSHAILPEDIERERRLRFNCLRLAFEQCCHPLAPPAVGETTDPFALAERIFAFVMGHAGKPEGVA